MNNRICIALAGFYFMALTSAVFAAPECWRVAEFRGTSMMSNNGYAQTANRLPDPVVVCFNEDTGTVTGNDVPLFRMGNSTLAGVANNGEGGETMVVYQLNRKLGKMILLQTRVGTETFMPLLPDIASLFAGDAVRAK